MSPNRKFIFLVTLAMVLAALPVSALAGYKRINLPNPADPMAVEIYRLDNGLTVYLTENHESPRFEAQIAVRVGSKNDPPETTGLAHYLEHLLFKGTTHLGTTNYALEKPHLDRITALYEQHFHETDPVKRKAIYEEINKENQLASQYEIPNEMDKLYKALGEEGLNAHTGREGTVFEVNLPSNQLEQWAVIESERFQHPVFRLFQPELEIVYEEKNRSLDNKDNIIFDAVNKLLFKQHPYGQQTTIGEVEHLKNPSLGACDGLLQKILRARERGHRHLRRHQFPPGHQAHRQIFFGLETGAGSAPKNLGGKTVGGRRTRHRQIPGRGICPAGLPPAGS